MKRVLLSLLYLVMAFGLYGEENKPELTVKKERYMAEKNKVWIDFFSNISLYSGSKVLEQTSKQLLEISEQQTLQQFVDERLKTYKSKVSYSDDLLRQLKRAGFVGHDYIIARPKGAAVGNCQTFEVIRTYQEKDTEKMLLRIWTFVYDMKNDKVLTVDDIFVPETATLLKNNAGSDYISLFVKDKEIYYGSILGNDYIKYETLKYAEYANEFTEQFKQAIAFERLAEADREAVEKVAKNLLEDLQQEGEDFVKIPYILIKYDSGDLLVSEHFRPNLLDSEPEAEQSSYMSILAGKYILESKKNTEGTTDSLWVRHSIQQRFKEKGEYDTYHMSYELTSSFANKTWTTIYNIEVPIDNPIFEQHLCKLLLDKNGKTLEAEREIFARRYFAGKKIGEERANAIKIEGQALTYEPGKYYSYAYRHTYLIRKKERRSTSSEVIGEPFLGNIIYDIENQKVLSLSDVLTAEEIAHLGLKKKSEADLGLDKYCLHVGIDGKPIRRYALSRENWNKFASALQGLIGPYDNLPAKIDSTVLVCQNFKGVQPASVSYKINQEPLYKGHTDSLLVYLKSHLLLPDNLKSRQSWKVQFVVGKDGQVSHVETKADKNSGGDESFASKLTETFEQMPAWQPLELAELGVQESLLTYKIQFVPNTTNLDDIISEMVDTNPQFPGGIGACIKWITENIKYPEECMKKKIVGRVFVSFIVNEDGSTSEIKIIKSPHPSLAKEAERVVKMMPKWKPATFGGEPIRFQFLLSI